MAKVEKNLLTEGLRGKVGNLVFRKRGKKTTVYVLSKRKSPPSKKQIEGQLRFTKAVGLAREALDNVTERKKFEKIAKKQGKDNAFNAAISYYMLNK